MKSRLLLIVSLLAFIVPALAQQTLQGTVKDAETGETLVGVTIMIKGTTQGTISDIDGNYSLEVQPASVVAFSYVGYQSIEETVGARTRIDVSLQPEAVMMDELVVVGYGSTKKRNVLGAVTKVDAKELTRIPVAGVDQALQGRAAGVQVTQNTGAPGEGVSVRIRGAGSISSSNSPLYIVDGMPTSDALNILSPADIESITVLKDASASAIYGSRANNGIVLITTRKGKQGKARVNYSGQYGFQKAVRLTPMVNTADYITAYNEAATNDNKYLPPSLQRTLISSEDSKDFADVKHLEELLQTAPITSHEFSISGGSENTDYFISGSLFSQEGIIKNTGYTRGTARVDVNSKVNKWLSAGISMLTGISNNDIIGSSGDGYGGNGGSVVRYAFFRNPAIPVRFPDGRFVDRPAELYGAQVFDSYLGDGYNPVGMAELNDHNVKADSYLGKAYLKAQVNKEISLTTNYGIDYRNSFTRRFSPTWGTDNRINARNGLGVADERVNNWTFNTLANYEKSYSERHNFSAMLGFEAIKNHGKALYASDSDFPIEQEELIYIGNGTGQKTTSQGEWVSTLASFFGRVSYDFHQRYYLSATIRRDGSSRFTGDNKWGNFYSVSAGWLVNQEAFLNDVAWIETLKLRAGYGAIGNQEIGLYAYSDRISPYFNYPFGGITANGYSQTSLGNENLKWETSYQYNAGVDAELWSGALAFSVDYFYKVTGDMLVKAPNPPSVGDAEASWINSGSVLNTGVELEVAYRKNNSNWGYSVGANGTFIHNEVLELDAALLGGIVETGVYATRTEVGQSIGSFYLLEMEGIFQNEADVLLSAFQGNTIRPGDVKFKDQNGDNRIDNNDRVFLGSAIPKVFAGVNLTGYFKQFDIALFFQGTYGNKIYVQVNQDIEGFYRGFPVTQRYFDERWTGDGTSNTQPRPAWTAKSNNARPSSRFLEDGSYVRLKNVQLGYTLPKALLNRAGIASTRFFVSATNLITLTKYPGLDPEMTVSDNSRDEGDLANGIDWGTYPSAMTFMLGVNINF